MIYKMHQVSLWSLSYLQRRQGGEIQLKMAVPMSQGYPGGWYKVPTQKVERGGLLEAELEGASSRGE